MTARSYRENKLSRFLKKRRQLLGLSTVDVETLTQDKPKEFRVSQSFIWQVEKGAIPSPYKLLSLCRLYKVPAAEIFKVIAGDAPQINADFSSAELYSMLFRNHKHAEIHKELQSILEHGEPQKAEWLLGNIKVFYSEMELQQSKVVALVGRKVKLPPARAVMRRSKKVGRS